ncbi:DUF5060 domain-containing protein [Aquiflexum lacus]|uniref:DUF5060 domain-containing protein n=1 Tax=Aquiflexum lacus TaxID=2483805 RepID=UPI001E46D0EE|nr:DUF5060 domain-containing protein [Aquiflexum lacus]
MSCKTNPELQKIEQWSVFEIELTGPETGNTYLEVSLEAIFTKGNEKVEVPGFFDGNGVYRIRFSPPTQGTWDYQTSGSQGKPENLETNVHILAKPGEVYLAHVADTGVEINLNLKGEGEYRLDVMDTWKMKTIESKNVPGDPFTFTTSIPYTALKFQKIE